MPTLPPEAGSGHLATALGKIDTLLTTESASIAEVGARSEYNSLDPEDKDAVVAWLIPLLFPD